MVGGLDCRRRDDLAFRLVEPEASPDLPRVFDRGDVADEVVSHSMRLGATRGRAPCGRFEPFGRGRDGSTRTSPDAPTRDSRPSAEDLLGRYFPGRLPSVERRDRADAVCIERTELPSPRARGEPLDHAGHRRGRIRAREQEHQHRGTGRSRRERLDPPDVVGCGGLDVVDDDQRRAGRTDVIGRGGPS